MKKLDLVVILTAVLLIGMAIVFNFVAPTGAAVSVPGAGLGGNLVTMVAVIAIAGIVVVTLYKKFD